MELGALSPAWKRVSAIFAVTMAAWVILITLSTGEIIPPVVIFATVFIIWWGVIRWRPNRITFSILIGLGLAAIGGNLPFLLSDLGHPESAFGFITGMMPLAASLLAIAVGLAGWGRLSDNAASKIWVGAAVLFLLAATFSVVQALGLEDEAAAAGDITLTAESADWEPATLTAAAGTVAIHVQNQDPIRHTFAIEALDVEVEVPAATDRRVEFTAAAGTYEFICTVPGHEAMIGTIVVGG